MTTSRDRILSALRERIVCYAASRLGKDTAEDLAQEALLVLEQKYSHLSSLDDLMPLCFQILNFKMRDFRRKTTRRGEWDPAQVADLPLSDGKPNALDLMERASLLERLKAAVAASTGRCRDLIRLKLEGKSFAQIQAELGAATINTVYTWDFRCRQDLMIRLRGKEYRA